MVRCQEVPKPTGTPTEPCRNGAKSGVDNSATMIQVEAGGAVERPGRVEVDATQFEDQLAELR